MNTEKLWTKDFIILSIINFLVCMQFLLGMVVIAPYAMKIFDSSASIAGLASGIYVLGAALGRPAAGRIIGDHGSKKVLIISSIIYTVITALYLFKISLPLLIIIRLLNGFAYGIVATTAATIIAQIVPVRRQAEGISYYSMSSILSMAGGPFLAIILVQYTDYKFIFLFNVILAAIGLVLSFTDIKTVQATGKQVKENTAKHFEISNYFEYKVIPIGSIAIIVALVYSSILTFLSLYATQLHLEKASSYFFFICAIVVLFSRPFSGRLFDVKGANIVMYPSLFTLAMSLFLFAQANNGIVLLLSAVLFGLGWGNFQSCAQALAIKLTPPHRYGVGTATYFSLYEIGLGSGPYFCGYLVQFIGLRYLYLIMGVVIIAAIILYYFLQGRKEKELNYSTSIQ